MDNLTFWAKIAEILGSMAWPALVAAVLVAYRGHVAGLFDRITELIPTRRETDSSSLGVAQGFERNHQLISRGWQCAIGRGHIAW
jgi:hypothetical protein